WLGARRVWHPAAALLPRWAPRRSPQIGSHPSYRRQRVFTPACQCYRPQVPAGVRRANTRTSTASAPMSTSTTTASIRHPLHPAPLNRSCSRRGSCSGYVVLRGEKAPDDALARELGAMGLL